ELARSEATVRRLGRVACRARGVACASGRAARDVVPVARFIGVDEAVAALRNADVAAQAIGMGRAAVRRCALIADLAWNEKAIAARDRAAPAAEVAEPSEPASGRRRAGVADLGSRDLPVAAHTGFLTVGGRDQSECLGLDCRSRGRARVAEAFGRILAVVGTVILQASACLVDAALSTSV